MDPDVRDLEERLRQSLSAEAQSPGTVTMASHLLGSLDRNSAPNTCRAALQLFAGSGYQEVRFFALQIVERSLGGARACPGNSLLSEETRAALRSSLLDYLRSLGNTIGSHLPVFLRNKLAVILTQLLKIDYPRRWPAAWAEIQDIARAGPSAANMLVRVIVALEEDAIAFHVDREREEIECCTALKDAMREGSPSPAASILEFCLGACEATAASSPQEAAPFIEGIGSLLGWVDEALATDEAVLSVLGECMGHADLLEDAANALDEVVRRHMPHAAKAQLLAKPAVFPHACQVLLRVVCDGVQQRQAVTSEALLALCQLVDGMVREMLSVCEARDELQHLPGASTVVGRMLLATSLTLLAALSAVPPEASQILLPSALQLARSAPPFSGVFPSDEDGAALVVAMQERLLCTCVAPMDAATQAHLEFLSATAAVVQRPPPFDGLHVYGVIFGAVVLSGKLPDAHGLRSTGAAAISPAEEEREALEEDVREALAPVFVNAAKAQPSAALAFLQAMLERLPSPLCAAPACALDAALHCTRLLLDVAGKPQKRNDTSGLLGSGGGLLKLIGALLESEVAGHENARVALEFFEVATDKRYLRALIGKTGEKGAGVPRAQAQAVLTRLLSDLCGTRGLQNSHPRLRARCPFLLLRAARVCGPLLLPLVSDLFGVLMPLVRNPGASGIEPKETLHLYETLGMLLALDGGFRHLFQATVRPLSDYIVTLGRDLGCSGTNSDVTSNLAYCIRALTAVTCARRRDASAGDTALVAELKIALVSCSEGLFSSPGDPEIRAATRIFLHRLLPLLSSEDLSDYRKPIEALITQGDGEDLREVVELYNQIAVRCGSHTDATLPGHQLLDEFFLPMLQRIESLAPQRSSDGQMEAPHVLTLRAESANLFNALVSGLIVNGMPQVLSSTRNGWAMSSVLEKVVAAMVLHGAPSAQRLALNTWLHIFLQHVAPGDINGPKECVGTSKIALKGFLPSREVSDMVALYARTSVLPASLSVALHRAFDPADAVCAQTATTVGEVLLFSRRRLVRGCYVDGNDAFLQVVLGDALSLAAKSAGRADADVVSAGREWNALREQLMADAVVPKQTGPQTHDAIHVLGKSVLHFAASLHQERR